MNPNFKRHMITDKLLEACKEQVQKYFTDEPVENWGCLICMAGENNLVLDCMQCPLSDGVEDYSCAFDETYIPGLQRNKASKKKRLIRGNRLIKIMDKHGIEIYDAEVKE